MVMILTLQRGAIVKSVGLNSAGGGYQLGYDKHLAFCSGSTPEKPIKKELKGAPKCRETSEKL